MASQPEADTSMLLQVKRSSEGSVQPSPGGLLLACCRYTHEAQASARRDAKNEEPKRRRRREQDDGVVRDDPSLTYVKVVKVRFGGGGEPTHQG